MVIVMPAFAERDEREDETVATVVFRFITTLAEQMRQRIDARRGMEQNRGADEKSLDEQLPGSHTERREKMGQETAERKQRDGEQKRHQRIKAVQKDQLRELREIADA